MRTSEPYVIASAVAVEDAGLRQSRETLLDGPGPGVAHALDGVEIVGGGPHDFLEVAEVVGDLLDDGLRQTRDLRQQAVALGLGAAVELAGAHGQVDDGGDGLQV